MRSDALKKAQKKYFQKIREENTEVYQKMRIKQNNYLKNYVKRRKEEDDEYRLNLMEINKKGAKIHYEKYKTEILKRRKELRDIKKDQELTNFLNNNIIEISIDF